MSGSTRTCPCSMNLTACEASNMIWPAYMQPRTTYRTDCLCHLGHTHEYGETATTKRRHGQFVVDVAELGRGVEDTHVVQFGKQLALHARTEGILSGQKRNAVCKCTQRPAQLVVPAKSGQRRRRDICCHRLVVILSVLDVIPTDNLYLAQTCILFPLHRCESNNDDDDDDDTHVEKVDPLEQLLLVVFELSHRCARRRARISATFRNRACDFRSLIASFPTRPHPGPLPRRPFLPDHHHRRKFFRRAPVSRQDRSLDVCQPPPICHSVRTIQFLPLVPVQPFSSPFLFMNGNSIPHNDRGSRELVQFCNTAPSHPDERPSRHASPDRHASAPRPDALPRRSPVPAITAAVLSTAAQHVSSLRC